METSVIAGVAREVRGFLAGLRRELPELFAAPPPAVCFGGRKTSGPGAPGRELLEGRVRHWSAVMGVSPRRVFLKNQRTRWGSCSSRGNLNFNRALAAAPAEVLDYVVIHELAHLLEMNHSRRFWAIVERWCPGQRSHRAWLRGHEDLLRRGSGRPR